MQRVCRNPEFFKIGRIRAWKKETPLHDRSFPADIFFIVRWRALRSLAKRCPSDSQMRICGCWTKSKLSYDLPTTATAFCLRANTWCNIWICHLRSLAGKNYRHQWIQIEKGYKQMFGNTIFGHLAESRLEKSRTALQQSEKTIAEIAFELRYSSVQHFSAAFKKRYGIPPGLAIKSP